MSAELLVDATDLWPETQINLNIQITEEEWQIAFSIKGKVGSISTTFHRCKCKESKQAIRYYLLLLLLENDPTYYWTDRHKLMERILHS